MNPVLSASFKKLQKISLVLVIITFCVQIVNYIPFRKSEISWSCGILSCLYPQFSINNGKMWLCSLQAWVGYRSTNWLKTFDQVSISWVVYSIFGMGVPLQKNNAFNLNRSENVWKSCKLTVCSGTQYRPILTFVCDRLDPWIRDDPSPAHSHKLKSGLQICPSPEFCEETREWRLKEFYSITYSMP